MCFAFFDVPSLIATDFAALLSVCILMLVRTSNASLMKLMMQRRPCAAAPIAYSSDSADESAIVACVLLP